MDVLDIPLVDASIHAPLKPTVLEHTTEITTSPSDEVTPQLTPSISEDDMSSNLLGQPPEILQVIFQNVDPVDLAALRSTCRHLRQQIDTDKLLWQLHYEWLFGPAAASAETWQVRTARKVKLQRLLESAHEDVKTEYLDYIFQHTLELALESPQASSLPRQFLAHHYSRGLNINTVLSRSSLFSRARPQRWTAAPTSELRQLSAQLHVLAGMNLDSPWPTTEDGRPCPHAAHHEDIPTLIHGISDEDGETDVSESEEVVSTPETEASRSQQRDHPTPIRDTHPWARSRVYDLRGYKASNFWGPFTDDFSQRVDWEKVQSIMIDLAFNHKLYGARRGLEHLRHPFLGWPPSLPGDAESSSSNDSTGLGLLKPWGEIFNGIAQDSFQSVELEGKIKPSPYPDLDALDPYGVSGTWMRIVCFLDYNDLYRFNFEHNGGIPADQERDPISTREAFRLIKLQLHVTSVVPQVDGTDEGGDAGRELLPMVTFEGTSRSTTMAWDPNANSRIRGTVAQTPSGSIRWTSFSIFNGEERWRSEGVQIGGLRSARGILGNWFDKDFDQHGPAGPTAFWKISDMCVEEPRREGGVQIWYQ